MRYRLQTASTRNKAVVSHIRPLVRKIARGVPGPPP
jgi:hypothetical protein